MSRREGEGGEAMSHATAMPMTATEHQQGWVPMRCGCKREHAFIFRAAVVRHIDLAALSWCGDNNGWHPTCEQARAASQAAGLTAVGLAEGARP